MSVLHTDQITIVTSSANIVGVLGVIANNLTHHQRAEGSWVVSESASPEEAFQEVEDGIRRYYNFIFSENVDDCPIRAADLSEVNLKKIASLYVLTICYCRSGLFDKRVLDNLFVGCPEGEYGVAFLSAFEDIATGIDVEVKTVSIDGSNRLKPKVECNKYKTVYTDEVSPFENNIYSGLSAKSTLWEIALASGWYAFPEVESLRGDSDDIGYDDPAWLPALYKMDADIAPLFTAWFW